MTAKFVLDTFNVDLLAPLSWSDLECDEGLVILSTLRPAVSLAIAHAVAKVINELGKNGVTIHVKPGLEVGDEDGAEVAA